jgi:ParB-like chromosome segregation protein Spo0J
MPQSVKLAFERQIVMMPLASILPLKRVAPATKQMVKYKRIAASIAAVGIIEPLVVAPPKEGGGPHLLLDGHLRFSVLIDLGEKETRCLIASDDEAFTYNKRVNRLATVQEHFMIVKALERGVPEGKLAKALNVNIEMVKRRRILLDGICPEVIDLLKDRSVDPTTFDSLRKMKPMRQIEAAELMAAVGNFSSNYAKALLAATKQQNLVHPERPKRVGGITPEQMARMEREMDGLQRDFKAVEATYGDDVLHLVIASGYLAKLIGNSETARYLEHHHAEILDEFRAIVAAASLDQTSAST